MLVVKCVLPTNHITSCSSLTQTAPARLIKADNELHALSQPMETNEDVNERVKESGTGKRVKAVSNIRQQTVQMIGLLPVQATTTGSKASSHPAQAWNLSLDAR